MKLNSNFVIFTMFFVLIGLIHINRFIIGLFRGHFFAIFYSAAFFYLFLIF
jgi:hypothetical protein